LGKLAKNLFAVEKANLQAEKPAKLRPEEVVEIKKQCSEKGQVAPCLTLESFFSLPLAVETARL
jgi:hypothetical protein